MTDANLILGRLLPEYFPKIFGPNENEALDYNVTRKKFEELQKEINSFLLENGQRTVCFGIILFLKVCIEKIVFNFFFLLFHHHQTPLSIEEIAMGFIFVANEAMCRPIRALTQSRGYDTSKHVLACFGGAGGQHACSIARDLGMSKIVIHKYAGILSAYGMALADVVFETQEPCGLEYSLTNVDAIRTRLNVLAQQSRIHLRNQGFDDDHIVIEPFLHLRYDATDTAIMCTCSTSAIDASNMPDLSVKIPDYGDFYGSFLKRCKY